MPMIIALALPYMQPDRTYMRNWEQGVTRGARRGYTDFCTAFPEEASHDPSSA